MKTSIIYLLSAMLIAITTSLQAGSLTVPSTFSAGTPAVAAEVNGNFTAVKTAVDDNDSRITALETVPVTGLDALSCTSGQITQWDGSAWICSAPTIDTNTDALSSLSCSAGQVAQWNGTAWACTALPVDTNTDTLASLSCAIDEVVKWDGAAWVCSSNASSQTTEVQVETVTQLFDALTAITDNSVSKPYVIQLAPGVYDVSVINMKPWISIVGAGQKSTFLKITSAGPVIEGADNAELRALTLVNTGGSGVGGSGISCNNVSGGGLCTSANTFRVKDVEITSSGASGAGGIYVNNAALTVVDSDISVSADAGNVSGFYALNTTAINLIRTDVTVTSLASTLSVSGLLLSNTATVNAEDSQISATGGSSARGVWASSGGAINLTAYNTRFSGANGSTLSAAVFWNSTGNTHIERSSLNGYSATGKAVDITLGSVSLVNSYIWGESSAFSRTGGTLTLYDTYPNGGAGSGGATCVGINYATGLRVSIACQ